MSNIMKYAQEKYQASNEGTLNFPWFLDALHIRTVTQSVQEHIFPLENRKMHVYDVSGLRQHRKHWISYFTEVHAILFVASLACYDQWMVEDQETNRMVDAIKVNFSLSNEW